MHASFPQRLILSVLVTITGACVLVIEVLSVRLFAPYFGNTLPALSSILGVTLLALSCGYVIGGRIADRRLDWAFFFGLILLSGLFTAFVRFSADPLLSLFSRHLSPVSGPLLACIVLFFIPIGLLGMLSPFAIALQKRITPEQGVGSVSGSIFFWSTLGSIIGSLLTGFVLIPMMGIYAILLTLSWILISIGAIGILCTAQKSRTFFLLLGALLPFIAILLSPIERRLHRSVVHAREGLYQNIRVVESTYEGFPIFLLLQDRNASSGMFLDRDNLVFDYTKYYRLATEFRSSPVRRALFIGVGAFSMPKDLLTVSGSAIVDAVDIEPSLFEIAQTYFRLESSDRLHWYVEDGRTFLRESDQSYDLIFSDVYQDFLATPTHFTTREFFELTKRKLSTDGVMMANVIGSLREELPSLVLSEMRTFAEVFPIHRFFAVTSPKSDEIQNLIFMGCKAASSCPDPCGESVRASRDPVLRSACEHQVSISQNKLQRHAVFTDDYAPVEYFGVKMDF